jgi:hypothetical protein
MHSVVSIKSSHVYSCACNLSYYQSVVKSNDLSLSRIVCLFPFYISTKHEASFAFLAHALGRLTHHRHLNGKMDHNDTYHFSSTHNHVTLNMRLTSIIHVTVFESIAPVLSVLTCVNNACIHISSPNPNPTLCVNHISMIHVRSLVLIPSPRWLLPFSRPTSTQSMMRKNRVKMTSAPTCWNGSGSIM